MSPFDIVKSLTQTKNDLYESEEIVDKDYVPFIINRILSMSRQTVLFADVMNQFGSLDKRLQYDFYRLGIPKSNSYSKWIKKDDSEVNQEHIDHICEAMHVSADRAIDLYKLMGAEAVQKDIEKRGGKK
jgi:Bacteriophage clamp loader A subunit